MPSGEDRRMSYREEGMREEWDVFGLQKRKPNEKNEKECEELFVFATFLPRFCYVLVKCLFSYVNLFTNYFLVCF